MALSIELRKFREAAGLTQNELARKAKTEQGTVSRIEGGKVALLDLAIFERLCVALGVTPGDLLVLRKRR